MAAAPTEILEGVDLAEIAKRLPDLPAKERRELLLSLKSLKRSTGAKQKGIDVPKTDDELWEYIKVNTGYEIPRVAVCEDHCAPFDFVADFFFERERALLVMASREAGKTISTSIVHYVNAECRPGVESCTFGAIEAQAKRAYCVSSDTLIDCPRDHRKYPDGVPISEVIEGQLVWTFNVDEYKFELKRVRKTWESSSSAHVLKLTLDSGDVIRATPEHRFLTRNNEWVELQNLCVGDSLMPMYRDFEPYIWTFEGGKQKEFYKVAHEAFGYPRQDGVVHHIDNFHANTSEENLEVVSNVEHSRRHAQSRWDEMTDEQRLTIGRRMSEGKLQSMGEAAISNVAKKNGRRLRDSIAEMTEEELQADSAKRSGAMKKVWDEATPEWREAMSRIQSKAAKRMTPEKLSAMEAMRAGRKNQAERVKWERKKICVRCNEEKPLALFAKKKNGRGYLSRCNECYELEQSSPVNHRVVSIEPDGCEAVWDMDVDGNHNFVVHGVVLHNSYIKEFVYEHGENGKRVPKPQIDGEPLRSETNWKSGSKIELLVGSLSGVNSPHPQKVHADEVDLMEDDVFAESRNMASSKKLSDGTRVRAQDVATSTRKSSRGLMQKLIDEIEEAERNGHKPAWKLYSFCVFEAAEEVPHCRRADPEERRTRLTELDRDPCELCSCDRSVKGEWAEDNPRTLESVCRGKFFKSRGWMAHEDVEGKFMQNSQVVWEAQMECRRPSADGLYLPTWTRERFCCRGWEPRPDLGNIYQGIDWGGSAESAVIWVQGPLHLPVEITGFLLDPIVVPADSYVVFAEIQKAGIGATKLADMVVAQEARFRQRYPGWRVKARFADMAGRQQRDDWREHDPPLRTHWYLPNRDFDPTVRCLQDLVEDGHLFTDVESAPILCDEFESWRQKNGKQVDEFNHGTSAARYLLTNTTTIEKRRQRKGKGELPVVQQRRGSADPTGSNAVGTVGSRLVQSERWREDAGIYVPNGPGSYS